MDGIEALVAQVVPGVVPVRDARGPLRVLIASLAPGGAERIVLEWLGAERAHGRTIELAVLHPRRNALDVPPGIAVRERGAQRPEAFVAALAARWRGDPSPVSTHLVTDDFLKLLWEAGVRTVPTVHNTRAGWRNDPRAWNRCDVPLALACAESVRRELAEEGGDVPLVTLRHRPRVGAAAFDLRARAAIRAELGIAPNTFLVGAIGALKQQKDYPRALAVLAELSRRRDAALVILGGILDRSGLAQLDQLMDRALALGVAPRLRLPGFVRTIEPWLAACDALLNVSRYEGMSIAVQEALAAGLPVVATDVGGQCEIAHPLLDLVAAEATPRAIAERLAHLPVRTSLAAHPFARAPRLWSLATFPRMPSGPSLETLFVTANLNAGGAQRSLVNLACALSGRHRLAVAVCGESTHGAFAAELGCAGVDVFRPARSADPFAATESLLAHAQSSGAANLCFWNVDPRVKLLAAKFAPPALRVIDVSPGAYAFLEMEGADAFAESIATSRQAYYDRLDALVLKYRADAHPACSRVEVIANGVERREAAPLPASPRFLVSGRIAPSKRLEIIVEALAQVHSMHPCAELHIVGAAEERHREYAEGIVRIAGALPVRFRGACFDHSHLDEGFTAAVVLGTHQGSPNAVLEAMAAGIAVIANDSGGTREVVAAGETGWLLAEDALAGDLAAAMLEAIDRPGHAARMAARARARVRAEFTIDAMARRYLELLDGESPSRREKMVPWNSASAPAARLPLVAAPSPATALP